MLDWLTGPDAAGLVRNSPWQLSQPVPSVDPEWGRLHYTSVRQRWAASGFGPSWEVVCGVGNARLAHGTRRGRTCAQLTVAIEPARAYGRSRMGPTALHQRPTAVGRERIRPQLGGGLRRGECSTGSRDPTRPDLCATHRGN